MKILKFDKINFGSYENFTWDNGLEEFKTINIFYGRNYSGKTTLSRIARSFELKKHNEDFLDGNFLGLGRERMIGGIVLICMLF